MTTTDIHPNTIAANTPKRLRIERIFSTPGVHPYDEINWTRRDVSQKNWSTGEVVFEQSGVEFPDFWSENASTIVTTKYFRGAVGSDTREFSLRQLIDRVVGRYVDAAAQNGYVSEPELLEVFEHELTWMLIHQVFSFNSPVWFNVGTTSPQQVSACFILAVDDSMDAILNWYKEEGLIFKGGSGAGLNLSRIRSSKELLKSSGGTASGPVSFMRGADASAGTIKSGGATRRAAKMVVLDVDHPDIVEFIETKAKEEDKIRVLRDAGYDMDLGGADIVSVQYQNANNSVRVTDEFMRAVETGSEFGLRARTNNEVIETVDARTLFQQIAQAAWACADPGMQYDDTINAWHTNPITGPITASNPCSEYMSLDNSSCNLASLNLMKFLNADNTFDIGTFTKAVEFIITAMEISISFADFPTDPIGETTRNFRQLGIGYANLGALLMAKGLAYDSADGRTFAAAITSLMTGVSYRRSAEVAGVVGPYAGYAVNRAGHLAVMNKHKAASDTLVSIASGKATLNDADYDTFPPADTIGHNNDAALIAMAAAAEWDENLIVGADNGWRNAQASVLAPTGTIGFMMDCDTTGVEPDFSLKKFKKLVGGGSMEIVNNQVPRALTSLGYTPEQIVEIVEYVMENGNVVAAPHLAEAHYSVFDCAAGQPRSIQAMGHVTMMAAVQPFLSGAISKTVNLPETATVKEIADIYYHSWQLGLKATAVYRDNCKVGQPLSDSKAKKVEDEPTVEAAAAPIERIVEVPRRERLERRRTSHTTSFNVAGADGYMTVGEFEDGRPGELFLKMSKQGSTLSGVMDAFSVAISIGLQYGVPLETFVSKYINQRFEPAGLTDDSEIRMAQSITDYLFRRLALDYLPLEVREQYGIYSVAERTKMVDEQHGTPEPPAAVDTDSHLDDDVTVEEAPIEVIAAQEATPVGVAPQPPLADIEADLIKARKTAATADAPDCSVCATSRWMVRAGACWACRECGTSSGCS